MVYQVPHFIDGQKLIGDGEVDQVLFNPATGEGDGRVRFACLSEIDRAVDSAKGAFDQWSQMPLGKRAGVLFRFKALVEKHRDELASLVTMEHGKVLSDAQASVDRGLELIEFACGIPELLKGSHSENVATGVDCYTVRQPLGVCVGISPFNFPVMIPLWMLVPAIACGNTFILKPSEKDPSAPLKLAELFHKAGLPDGVLNVVNGNQKVVESLISHSDVQAVTAVGSTPVAQSIYQMAIANNKRAHTFGGAKNHAIVMPDADLDAVSAALTSAAYGSAGERCMALSVAVIVGDQTADALVSKLKDSIDKIKIGPGDHPKVDMGPLVTQEHRQRVLEDVDMGDAMYTMFKCANKEIGGMMQIPQGQEKEIPPHWMSYINVDNLDDMVAKAKSLGANIKVDITKTGDFGRFAIICDPTGAHIALWQSNETKA